MTAHNVERSRSRAVIDRPYSWIEFEFLSASPCYAVSAAEILLMFGALSRVWTI